MGGAGIIKYVQYDPRVVFGGVESISDCVLARFLETNVDSKKIFVDFEANHCWTCDERPKLRFR